MSYFNLKTIPIFIVFGFLGATAVNGQKVGDRLGVLQKTNVGRLQSLKSQYALNRLQKKQQAEQLAQRFGWEIKKFDAYGNFMELQEVSYLGKPKYYITHGSKPLNLGSANTTRTGSLWTGGSLGLDLNGEGMLVGAWDGGAVRLTHQEFDANDFQSDRALTISNHATHIAGTLVGLGINASAKGMASMASLAAYDWNNDEAEMAEAAANGLLLSNHSYGWNPLFLATWEFGYYDSQAEAWDNIQYNAPYYLIVRSAGNGRNNYNTSKGGYDLVNGASTSKNTLVVAAVEGVTNYNQPKDVVMSSFSAWGPTDDGRIKPDISAKGVGVFSSYGTGDTRYASLSGTSMAAPNTTGSLLLLQQHYNNLKGAFMNASTLKAIINTAEEAGEMPGPDYKFGWGLLNVEKAALLISNKDVSAIIEEAALFDGGSYSMVVTSDGLTPLKANLVWTDPAGTPGPINIIDNPLPMLVNDLDIRITKGDSIYEPWVLDPANRAKGAKTGDNVVDNVEGITIDFPEAGDYTVTVTHKGTLTNGSQQFSLVVDGVSGGGSPVCEATVPYDLTTSAITHNTAVISWNTGAQVDSYDYRYHEKGDTIWTTVKGTVPTATLTGLRADTNYEFQVRSHCTDTTSAYSKPHGFTTTPIPIPCTSMKPTGVSSSGVTDNRARLRWNKVEGAAGYNYRFRPNGTRVWANRSSNRNNVTLLGLKGNTTYEYQVQTACTEDNSAFTEIFSFTTDQPAKIGATSCGVIPRHLSATTITGTSATVSWGRVIGASEYQYRYRPAAGGRWVSGKTNTNTVVLTGLQANTNYTFQMRAFCGRFSPIARMVFSTLDGLGVQNNSPMTVEDGLTQGQSLILYPNPVTDRLNVGIPEFESVASVLVYDVKGVKLIDDKIDFRNNSISVATLQPGMYYVRVITRSKSFARQFIKR